MRPKSAEPPRSPLLKRVQSEEKLSPSYTGDKKHLCPRKHSLEVTQEEVQDEEHKSSERDYTVLQSVDETACEPPAVTRVRPVEQGCLKRPISRKIGRQESVEDLDKEKLKSKLVVKRQDWSERRDSLQKQDALRESDSFSLCAENRDENILARGLNKSIPDSGSLEAKAAGSTLKDVLYKKLTTRVSEAIAETPGGSGGSDVDGGHRSTLCAIHPEWQHPRQSKDNTKPDRLEFKAPNIEFTRKRLSFEERDDCICRCSSTIHENLHFGSTRSKSLQLDTAIPHDHVAAGLGSVHSSPEGLTPKIFTCRGESAVEKLQLISSAESSLRKTSSEYKLEGRHISSLRPLEGTLDIGLLSGPRVSKTETCLSKMAESTCDTVSISPPIRLQTPAERQITIPQMKIADKLKSPLSCPPSAEPSLNIPGSSKDQANEQKTCAAGEKTLDRYSESLKAQTARVDAGAFVIKQDNRSGAKAAAALTLEHRGPRHSSHFCGKTPSIREVSNEDQEEEGEQQEAAQQSAVSAAKTVSVTSPKPVADVKTAKTAAASEPSPVSPKRSESCDPSRGKQAATSHNSKVTSLSEAQNGSASVENAQPVDICSSHIEPRVPAPASASAHKEKSCGLKPSGVDGLGRSDSEDGVQSKTSAVKAISESGSKKDVEQKGKVSAAHSRGSVTEASQTVNKENKTVSLCAIESSKVILLKAEDPASPKIKNVKEPEQLSKIKPAEKAQDKSSASEHCSSNKAELFISVKENQKHSPHATENAASPKNKPGPDAQRAAHGAAKTEKETKTLEVKAHSTSPSVPSKQRDVSKESTLAAPSVQGARHSKQTEALLPSAGADVKRDEPARPTHSSPTLCDVKQRETQPRVSAVNSANVGKESADSKPKSLSPKTVTSSSSAGKTSVTPAIIQQSPDAKQKESSPKSQATVNKNQQDLKPKHAATPQPPLQSHIPSQPDPPPVLPKPAARKEIHSSGGIISGRLPGTATQETVAKVSKEGPKSETPSADSHRSPENKTNTSDKQAAASKKEPAERKRKETVLEVTPAQKTTKKDASRAAPPAPKDTSERDTGRGKQQKESPRSSTNKK